VSPQELLNRLNRVRQYLVNGYVEEAIEIIDAIILELAKEVNRNA